MKAFAYIVRCADDTLYTGYTTDIKHRLAAHNSGKASKYTRGRTPVELVYLEECDDKNAAMSREWHIKRLTRAKKLLLIAKWEKARGADGEHSKRG
ncbi:MAG: GIY-YIG nuclease family protein [Anaerovibrio sp.]|uniref:GIY-YIG nuclease family protein n=1 Tax=Anaerovibrio sp. TaxID=1872532 RepID=UPI0025D090C2|nr:GIY-YIG nuclease family protein [Anaerovibrio sp.]MCR5175615.1 GIY-YIG nuclease family protein [Anaerovibrio sp.]